MNYKILSVSVWMLIVPLITVVGQPIFKTVEIEGTVLEQVAIIDSFSGWISFYEDSEVKPENYFSNYGHILGMSSNDEMVILKEKQDDLKGYEHYFYRQSYKGIEVEMTDYALHIKEGNIYAANGKIINGLNFDLNEAMSEETAKEIAISAVNAKVFAWEVPEAETQLKSDLGDLTATNYPEGKLIITQLKSDNWTNSNYRVAYLFHIISIEPDENLNVYVDAFSGAVIKIIDNRNYDSCVSGAIATQYEGSSYTIYTMNRGFPYNDYILETECIGGGTAQTGRYTVKEHTGKNSWWDLKPLITNASNTWNGSLSAPASCLWGVEQAYNYFKVTHGRNGTSNSSSKNMRIWYDVDNAFSSSYHNPVNDYDEILVKAGHEHSNVLSHEFTHGVFQNEVGVPISGTEADGIEESVCDIYSVMAEKYTFPSAWNWSTGNAAAFGFERFLNAPHSAVRDFEPAAQAAYYQSLDFGT